MLNNLFFFHIAALIMKVVRRKRKTKKSMMSWTIVTKVSSGLPMMMEWNMQRMRIGWRIRSRRRKQSQTR